MFNSHTSISFSKWLIVGILLEVVILVGCYVYFEEVGEVFRHAARYSGRISWLFYIFIFYFFASTYKEQNKTVLHNLRTLVAVFCVMHLIHFMFLATNISMNNIELVPVKLLGGGLGYFLIVAFPLFFNKITNNSIRLIYFYYLGIVIAVTYLARIKGDFEGAQPSTIHYIGLGSIIFAFIGFSIMIFAKKR